MQEWMLTQGKDLTTEEQTWMEQTCKLVSVMPPLSPPPRGLLMHPSTSTPLNQGVPNLPFMSTLSTESRLPHPNDLICQIFQTGRYPIPSFTSQYPRVMKHPSVATLMVPLSNPMKSGAVTG